jgi:hypothetical protein
VTNSRERRAIELAVCLAVMMHLLLFMAVRPSNGNGLAGVLVAPETHYLAKAPGKLLLAGSDVRTVWSPAIFSLPSEMGFSRDLLNVDLRTRLAFSQQVESESFLDVDPVPRDTGAQVIPQELMLTAGARTAPQLPAEIFQSVEKRPSARRISLAPELQERLIGGVVLPPTLNKQSTTPWEVRAAVSISKQGRVRHVFLDQPLESAKLNQEVIHLLYGLRFKSGDGPVEGSIEIYSPETTTDGGAVR